MHVIAAKAVAFKEALEPEFKEYQRQVVANAKALASAMLERGYDLVSGGTDNHLILVSLIRKGLTGKDAEAALDAAGITVNKNVVPFDPQKPVITSGIRIGTPAVTTRGMREPEMAEIASLIADALDELKEGSGRNDEIAGRVKQLCDQFPLYEEQLASMRAV